MEENKELVFNMTYECIGGVDEIHHLALYIHDWLKLSNNAEDYKESKIVLNADTAGCVQVAIWPDECRTMPPAWLMDAKMWRYFCKNIIENFRRSKEDI